MKKSSLRKIVLLCVLACAHIHTCAPAYAQASALTHEVTAAEYCDFLNQNAATDPDHLFDQKMATDPQSACIVRLGTPENYLTRSCPAARPDGLPSAIH